MAGFLTKIKSASSATPNQPSKETQAKKKDDVVFEVTPLEKMLQNAGPLREDGSDRFFGFENHPSYCNSIVQALFYSDLFRKSVIHYPPNTASNEPNGARPRVNVTLRPPMNPNPPTQQPNRKSQTTSQALKQRQAINVGQSPAGPAVKPEDKPDTPEYKKKQAMLKGPILELASQNGVAYGMDECTFTGLKDIFLALLESNTRTGVLSPQRFLEIFKRDNEMFRNSMHQDAHEFYGLVLNDVISNVEKTARKFQELEEAGGQDGLAQSVENIIGAAALNHAAAVYQSPAIGWVHDIFEGVLTSETRCLTCETASQRDETFLDLSIDLEEHASVTSCLRKFSAEEMLCERNKFHCDHCGGLQEAEKRMKVKRLPKVLTLHLKRFKYTEDYSRLQKLFHRVVYPYHLRMFNTTDDAEDPDRLYELYAVVVHIGGNAYHGHYVSIIKTKDRGWLLFDDEMVEPVDNHFVRNFFGDKPGMATAYVLFYQETTFDKVREEQEKEGKEEVKLATEAANVAHEDSDKGDSTPLKRQVTQPVPAIPAHDSLSSLAHAKTAPDMPTPALPLGEMPSLPVAVEVAGSVRTPTVKQNEQTKEDKKREKKEREAAEKAAKQAEKDKEKQAKAAAKEEEKVRERQVKDDERRRREEQAQRIQARRTEQEELQKVLDASKKTAAQEEGTRKKENGSASAAMGFFDRSKRGGKSMSRRSFSFFHKDKAHNDGAAVHHENGDTPETTEKASKSRLSMGLGRKKSSNLLSS
ncbi:ubiquitin hydrolase CreB [Metarhizium album ARSEF 1941]|uniref:ubiquitinyl hydrolase 1 n=1 Tax=Metarhizium album (strain ARSEF 1941) TaxID=1081103 RepID=A0A0B2WJJ2_METAS|nr:ubiquitin hydrolase CreB [Metarhizium album ARSEF 1941]KHN93854.1 ubiquitin hydrolase CreB [Metarhizium album ARSEF 1941]